MCVSQNKYPLSEIHKNINNSIANKMNSSISHFYKQPNCLYNFNLFNMYKEYFSQDISVRIKYKRQLYIISLYT